MVGTGSSGIQSIPLIAEQAEHLTVFQRTPAFSIPARNGPLDPDEVAAIKSDYRAFREANSQMVVAFGSRSPGNDASALEADAEERERQLGSRWERGGLPFLGAFNDLLIDAAANEVAAEYVRTKIRETVDDPATAELLCPNTVIGCKRLCLDTGYYQAFNRSNVSLVDVSTSPLELTPTGVRVGDETFELDALVFATGFDAMTGALLAVDLRGRGGIALADAWAEGPRTYLGLATAGFPNLFTITGPGSPSVLTNMIVSIEHHVEWITDCIKLPARPRPSRHRGHRRGPGPVGRVRQPGGVVHALPVVQLLVPGRQRPGQATGVHALARLPAVCRAVHRRGRQGLRGLRPGPLTRSTPGRRADPPARLSRGRWSAGRRRSRDARPPGPRRRATNTTAGRGTLL